MEKKFESPTAVIIAFVNEDIIVTSGEGDYGNTSGILFDDDESE